MTSLSTTRTTPDDYSSSSQNRRHMTDPTPQQTLFEGKPVTDTTVKTTGTISHVMAKPVEDLEHGDILIAIAVFEVDKVAFPRNDAGLVREHTLKVNEIHRLATGELDARRILAECRAETRKDVERRYGETPPGAGTKVTTGRPASEADDARRNVRSIGDDIARQRASGDSWTATAPLEIEVDADR